jgi:hypothetical protein
LLGSAQAVLDDRVGEENSIPQRVPGVRGIATEVGHVQVGVVDVAALELRVIGNTVGECSVIEPADPVGMGAIDGVIVGVPVTLRLPFEVRGALRG